MTNADPYSVSIFLAANLPQDTHAGVEYLFVQVLVTEPRIDLNQTIPAAFASSRLSAGR